MESSVDIPASGSGMQTPDSKTPNEGEWQKSLLESAQPAHKPKVFQIDPSLPSHSLNPLLLSTRAQNVLKSIGVNTLRDLDGVPHEKILESKNCGFKTYKEIALHAERLQRERKPSPVILETPSSPGNSSLISIPPDARNWNLDQLPFSSRLRHTLERLNFRRLGDLHGIPFSTLAEMPDCGVRTRRELQEFVDRVQRGEFGAVQEQAEKPQAAFLLSRIDAFLESTEPRWASIFKDRVGAHGEPMTLMQVGQKHDLTRERVRQVVDLLTQKVLLFGGPPFVEALQFLARELSQKLLPLTPSLWQNLTKSHVQPRHAWSFYVRWLGWLSPDISAWPTGQTPAAYRRTEQERVIQQIKQWFKSRTAPVPVQELYRELNTGDFHCTPFEFLEALRFAAEFAIDLKDPQNPRIFPPIETPRRWAQEILSTADLSTVPADVLARARALLHARRSPGSKYRLARGSQK